MFSDYREFDRVYFCDLRSSFTKSQKHLARPMIALTPMALYSGPVGRETDDDRDRKLR